MSEKGCKGALRVLVIIPLLIWLLVTWVCSCWESASSCVLMTRAIFCMYIVIKTLMVMWRQTATWCKIPSVLRHRQWPSLPISWPFPNTAPQGRTTLPAPLDDLFGHAQNPDCSYSMSFKKEDPTGPPLFKSHPCHFELV